MNIDDISLYVLIGLVAIAIIILLLNLLLRKVFHTGFGSCISMLATLIAAAVTPVFVPGMEGIIAIEGLYAEGKLQPVEKSLSIEALLIFVIAVVVGLVVCCLGILAQDYMNRNP